MLKSTEYSTENPHFQRIYKLLTEEEKAELQRLEEIEQQVKTCFIPLDRGTSSKLSYFAYVYTQYVALLQSHIDSDLALSISHFQHDLMRLETTIKQ